MKNRFFINAMQLSFYALIAVAGLVLIIAALFIFLPEVMGTVLSALIAIVCAILLILSVLALYYISSALIKSTEHRPY